MYRDYRARARLIKGEIRAPAARDLFYGSSFDGIDKTTFATNGEAGDISWRMGCETLPGRGIGGEGGERRFRLDEKTFSRRKEELEKDDYER